MAIQYLRRPQINDQQWNDCINHSNPSLPYAYSFYLDAVAPNWSALVLDDYAAVMPLPLRKKWFVQYVYQPIPCPQLGVFSLKILSPTQLTQFYEAIPAAIRYLNYGVNAANVHKSFGNFKSSNNFELELNAPYHELLMNYRYNCRRDVKLALQTKPDIRHNIQTTAIIELLKTNKQQKLPQLTQQVLNQLEQLMQVLIQNKIGFSVGINNPQQQLCAAIFYIKTPHRIINLINVSNATARKKMWIPVLIDQLIKTHAGQAITFDFEGSNIPSIAHFFKNFGPQKKTYYHWLWNRLPFGLRWLK